jgi:hypothetical protein
MEQDRSTLEDHGLAELGKSRIGGDDRQNLEPKGVVRVIKAWRGRHRPLTLSLAI